MTDSDLEFFGRIFPPNSHRVLLLDLRAQGSEAGQTFDETTTFEGGGAKV